MNVRESLGLPPNNTSVPVLITWPLAAAMASSGLIGSLWRRISIGETCVAPPAPVPLWRLEETSTRWVKLRTSMVSGKVCRVKVPGDVSTGVGPPPDPAGPAGPRAPAGPAGPAGPATP